MDAIAVKINGRETLCDMESDDLTTVELNELTTTEAAELTTTELNELTTELNELTTEADEFETLNFEARATTESNEFESTDSFNSRNVKKEAFTPENRTASARELAAKRAENDPTRRFKPAPAPAPKAPTFHPTTDKIMQRNEGQWKFSFTESRNGASFLVVFRCRISKFIDSSLLRVVVEREWMSVEVKSKVLHLAIPVPIDKSTSSVRRSTSTGVLEIVMVVEKGLEHLLDLYKSATITATTTPSSTTIHATSNRIDIVEACDDDDVPPLCF